MSEVVLFTLDGQPEPARLTIRPWGTRTLKVRLTTNTAVPPLRIRPKGMRPEDTQKGIFRAFADDSHAFEISWGGGHETGPCLRPEDFLMAFEKCAPLSAGDTSIIFFNVRHTGPDIPETAVLTLEAFDEESGDIFATLPVHLNPPPDMPSNPVRIVAAGEGQWRVQGNALPQYDPRWWPRPIAYLPTNAELPLGIVHETNQLRIIWNGKETAVITDHTTPSILDRQAISFELFHFDQWHVALRVWFFWLDKNIGDGFFIGRHEVPDAERFDFLIRRSDGKTTLACTDLHWREIWGQAEATPVQATIGIGRETRKKLIEEKLGKLFQKRTAHDHQGVYDPTRYIERLATRLGQSPDLTVRAKGTEAHLPMLHNVSQTNETPSRMTSSDVRLG